MTRLWEQGIPIRVRADSLGVPQSFTWEGRRYTVARLTRRWRVDEQWWRGRVWREYFELVTGSRLLAILYHDLASGEWCLQRVYD